MPGMFRFPAAAAECDRTLRLDGDNLDLWKYRRSRSDMPRDGAGRAGADENPIDLVELVCDLFRRLFGMNVLIGQIGILIEPDRVRIRLQYLINLLQPRAQ